MLQTLKIHNVALIKDIEIDFEKGFNVLLGETGAGKSIIFDALNFVLGDKADKTLIRTGENSMRVDAVFSDLSSSVKKELESLGIIDEEIEEIVLSRTLEENGKNSVRINGNLSSTPLLKVCGSVLVDSYSQHESIELLKSKNHLAMLDKLCGDEVRKLKEKIAEQYEKYLLVAREIKNLGGDEFERERTKSLLEYQIKEILDAELKEGEIEEIKARINLLTNSEKLVEASKLCENCLVDGSFSAINDVSSAINALNPLVKLSEVNSCVERLNSCLYEIEDIAETLKDLSSVADYDEGELDRLERRQDLIKSLCKKYGTSVGDVLEYLDKTQARLDDLNNAEERLVKLGEEKTRLEIILREMCEELTLLRQAGAKETAQKMEGQLYELGMKNTKFVINFHKLDNFSVNGCDDVEFAFSANVGQEVKALAKTASGGEMSRVMLAFKTIFAGAGLAQTLIFDEIDTGISGEIGYVVGEKLYGLTSGAQVICVTHLAQVASQGDAFHFVSKSDDGKMTFTQVKKLKDEEITIELARMLGGDKVTEVSLAHIKEMRKRAGKA